jgi:phosphopantothenoylcysteine decarboxylase/phosphopantothenate--cysteine ligase
MLAEQMVAAGHDVRVYLGLTARFHVPRAIGFSTNEELEQGLRQIDAREKVGAVFHAAALCDFAVASVEDVTGKAVRLEKMVSGTPWVLRLIPKPKVLNTLRGLFPNALIIGWKLEMEGTREAALRKALLQIKDSETDACVVNGSAFGEGFGYCTQRGLEKELGSKRELAAFLARRLR